MKSGYLLFCFTFLLHVQVASAGVSYLNFPGGGIPIFSKDKPVRKLNNIIEDFFSNKQGYTVDEGEIYFKDTTHNITLNTNLAVKAENLTIKNGFVLIQGQISIEIGNIKFQITPHQSSIFEGNKIVHTEYDTATNGIEFIRGYDLFKKNKLLQSHILRQWVQIVANM